MVLPAYFIISHDAKGFDAVVLFKRRNGAFIMVGKIMIMIKIIFYGLT